MPYLIDGHNLIPKVPGLALKDPEDELALIRILESFANRERAKVEVFFDQAPPSRAGSRSFGTVRAHFVRQGITADQAIVARLGKMGRESKNWTVVTSDREILAEARSAHSKTLSSSAFAGMLSGGNQGQGTGLKKGENPEVSGEEVDFWLDQFKRE